MPILDRNILTEFNGLQLIQFCTWKYEHFEHSQMNVVVPDAWYRTVGTRLPHNSDDCDSEANESERNWWPSLLRNKYSFLQILESTSESISNIRTSHVAATTLSSKVCESTAKVCLLSVPTWVEYIWVKLMVALFRCGKTLRSSYYCWGLHFRKICCWGSWFVPDKAIVA